VLSDLDQLPSTPIAVSGGWSIAVEHFEMPAMLFGLSVSLALPHGGLVVAHCPARYATLLAEDPGCTVLTLTSSTSLKTVQNQTLA
jgi:hypothetical protein